MLRLLLKKPLSIYSTDAKPPLESSEDNVLLSNQTNNPICLSVRKVTFLNCDFVDQTYFEVKRIHDEISHDFCAKFKIVIQDIVEGVELGQTTVAQLRDWLRENTKYQPTIKNTTTFEKGEKVVPIGKTVGRSVGLNLCKSWIAAQERNQHFLYVIYVTAGGMVVLSDNEHATSGEFFWPKDLLKLA